MANLIKKLEKKFLNTPPSLTFEGWDIWQEEQKKTKPIAYFVFWTLPAFFRRQKNRLRDLYWWFKHRIVPQHRYHLVDTKLSPGYWEYEQRMLHACFSLLVDFCEVALPSTSSVDKKGKTKEQIALEALDSYINFNHEIEMGNHRDLYKETKELYIWWQNRQINQHEDGFVTDEANEVDNEMLLRLVKIRGFLWV